MVTFEVYQVHLIFYLISKMNLVALLTELRTTIPVWNFCKTDSKPFEGYINTCNKLKVVFWRGKPQILPKLRNFRFFSK